MSVKASSEKLTIAGVVGAIAGILVGAVVGYFSGNAWLGVGAGAPTFAYTTYKTAKIR